MIHPDDPESLWARKRAFLGAAMILTTPGIPMIKQDLVSQSRTNITPMEIYDFERYLCEGFVGTRTQNAAANVVLDIEE